MLYLTINQIKSNNPCKSGWINLLKKAKEHGLFYPKDGDIPISMNTLLDWCPTKDVIWAFRCNWEEGKELYIKFVKSCAKRAKTYAAAHATYAAAYAAYTSDTAAHAATYAAAYAAHDVAHAAYAASDAAAHAAAYVATHDVAANAATYDVAYDAAYAVAFKRERSRQKVSLKTLLRHYKG